MSLYILHPSQRFELQKLCPACFYSLLHQEPCSAELNILCPTNIDLKHLPSQSTAKLGLFICTLCSLQRGRWNKEATRKSSSVKTGSLLLVTIPNMWHLREKWVPVAQALLTPAVVSTCCCPPSGFFTCWCLDAFPSGPQHLLTAWCDPLLPRFPFLLKIAPLFHLEATT